MPTISASYRASDRARDMSADEPLSPSPQANFLDDACDGVAIPSRLRTANSVRPALPPRHARALRPHSLRCCFRSRWPCLIRNSIRTQRYLPSG